MIHLEPPLATALAIAGGLAGAFDLYARRVPDWLVAVAFGAGLAIHVEIAGLPGATTALRGAALGLAVYLPLYILRAVGGGDLKLMAAVGAITGPALWLVVFVLASLLGGVLAVFVILRKGRIAATLANIGTIFRELLHLRAPHRAGAALDVTRSEGVRLPHATVIGVAIWLFLAGIWLGNP